MKPQIDCFHGIKGGPVLVKHNVFTDHRGSFFETHRDEWDMFPKFIQENQSVSYKNVLRGLHFQKIPNPQAKLVSCPYGHIFDVAVDIRPHSASFGKWVGVYLDGHRHDSFFVPEGFAHGFLVISDFAVVSYKCSSYYDQASEGSLRWDDPDVGIKWPLITTPTLSAKDQIAPNLSALRP